MNPYLVFGLAFLIGVIAGLRSLTAPAVVAWAAHLRWLDLQNTLLSFIGSMVGVAIFTALATVELIADKLPSAPNRTKPLGLIGRIIFGGLSGAAVAVSWQQSIAFGAAFGAGGGVAGAFGGYEVRTQLVKALKVPDFVVAVLEDVVAIVGGLFIVSRF